MSAADEGGRLGDVTAAMVLEKGLHMRQYKHG